MGTDIGTLEALSPNPSYLLVPSTENVKPPSLHCMCAVHERAQRPLPPVLPALCVEGVHRLGSTTVWLPQMPSCFRR